MNFIKCIKIVNLPSFKLSISTAVTNEIKVFLPTTEKGGGRRIVWIEENNAELCISSSKTYGNENLS